MSAANPPGNLINSYERTRLQGFRPSTTGKMRRTPLMEALGNAFSVPAIGAVLSFALRSVYSDGKYTFRPVRSKASTDKAFCISSKRKRI